MSAKLMAIVAEGDRGRVYLAPTPEHESIVPDEAASWLEARFGTAQQSTRLQDAALWND